MKKQINIIIIFVFVLCQGYAQKQGMDSFEEFKRNSMESYNKFKKETETQYNRYKDSINAQYAKFMEQSWRYSTVQPAKKAPDTPTPPFIPEPDPVVTPKPEVTTPEPDPVVTPKPEVTTPEPDPVVTPKLEVTTPEPDPVVTPKPEVTTPEPDPVVSPKPEVITPDIEREDDFSMAFQFLFYGTPCSVSLNEQMKYRLQSVDEASVAAAWRRLSTSQYYPLVEDCIKEKERLNLCDWAYLKFVENLSISFFGENNLNEAKVLQMYLLTQSGYKVRIARGGSNLVLLLPSKDEIYNYSYLQLKGANYYILDKDSEATSYAVFDHEFPEERWFSLSNAKEPRLADRMGIMRYYKSASGRCSVAFKINNNIIDFYRDYPRNGLWDVYVKASISEQLKSLLYPQLKKQIEGKSVIESANILLGFVQTAFKYKTDPEQFGEERPLFADETLFYPYSDCEDRSILFSILVHELLGLDVVLLNYPGHVATAVCFNNEQVAGDYFELNSKRYYICEPTFSSEVEVGRTGTQYKGVSPKIITIWKN